MTLEQDSICQGRKLKQDMPHRTSSTRHQWAKKKKKDLLIHGSQQG